MSYVTTKDCTDFLRHILQTEKKLNKENPLPSNEENSKKIKEFRQVVENMTRIIAEREGISIED